MNNPPNGQSGYYHPNNQYQTNAANQYPPQMNQLTPSNPSNPMQHGMQYGMQMNANANMYAANPPHYPYQQQPYPNVYATHTNNAAHVPHPQQQHRNVYAQQTHPLNYAQQPQQNVYPTPYPFVQPSLHTSVYPQTTVYPNTNTIYANAAVNPNTAASALQNANVTHIPNANPNLNYVNAQNASHMNANANATPNMLRTPNPNAINTSNSNANNAMNSKLVMEVQQIKQRLSACESVTKDAAPNTTKKALSKANNKRGMSIK